MSPALMHPPTTAARTPSRVVRDLAAARRRRDAEDLRQRAAWVEQARHTPRLEDWPDEDDPVDEPARGPVRIALLLARRR